MINVAPLRAAARATAGDVVGIEKGQLEQLLAEIEEGQRAQRELKLIGAIANAPGGAGIAGVSPLFG